MNLIIDAHNIKAGGGLTHLVEILNHSTRESVYFDKVIVLAPKNTLECINDKAWIEKVTNTNLDGGVVRALVWSRYFLRIYLKSHNNFIFIPGTGIARFPYATMCQNLLTLDKEEMNRYFLSKSWIRLKILRIVHLRAYKKSQGTIFLNQYCYQLLSNQVSYKFRSSLVIPHGLNDRFITRISKKSYPDNFTRQVPLRLIYVSTIDVYKHQWLVVRAVGELLKSGYSIQLDLVGSAYPRSKSLLDAEMLKLSEFEDQIRYHGKVPYDTIDQMYECADAFIFASTCETYGMVLLEAMGSGLPILSSNKSSMPETLGEAAVYFDPQSQISIQCAIKSLYDNPDLRSRMSSLSLKVVRNLSWTDTSNKTFSYLYELAKKSCVEL